MKASFQLIQQLKLMQKKKKKKKKQTTGEFNGIKSRYHSRWDI